MKIFFLMKEMEINLKKTNCQTLMKTKKRKKIYKKLKSKVKNIQILQSNQNKLNSHKNQYLLNKLSTKT